MTARSEVSVFDGLYAATYDVVYQAKDYGAEVEAVMLLLKRHFDGEILTVLDLGCGTGRHAVQLARRGLHVTGIDRSDTMLAAARGRSAEQQTGHRPEFVHADLRGFDLGRTYDAAVMMFNVLGYIVDNDGLLATLRAVRRHLKVGHPFVFDFWYGPSVIAVPPKDGVKEFNTGGNVVRRTTTTRHRPHDQRCDIDIRVQRFGGDAVVGTIEQHQVRYYFPLEIDLALRAGGFELVGIRRFPEIDEVPHLDDWSVVAVARAAECAVDGARGIA